MCSVEYERLRRQALTAGAGAELGAALLMRQGLALWLDAWTSVPALTVCGPASAALHRALPDPLQQEFVRVLAALVIRIGGEVHDAR